MLVSVARQTIIAAIVIALMAAGWQLATGGRGPVAGSMTAPEGLHADDD